VAGVPASDGQPAARSWGSSMVRPEVSEPARRVAGFGSRARAPGALLGPCPAAGGAQGQALVEAAASLVWAEAPAALNAHT
jgi:hypothetical protein